MRRTLFTLFLIPLLCLAACSPEQSVPPKVITYKAEKVDGSTLTLPEFLAVDNDNNLIIADNGGHRIYRRKDKKNEVIMGNGLSGTFDGTSGSATFTKITAMTVSPSGELFFAETNVIRKMDLSGKVTSIAGNRQESGSVINADPLISRFSSINGLVFTSNNDLIISDAANHQLYKISPQNILSIFSGTGSVGVLSGAAEVSQFNSPWSLTFYGTDQIIICDRSNHRVRTLNNAGVSRNLVGFARGDEIGSNNETRFDEPIAAAFDRTKNLVYVIDQKNGVVKRLTAGGTTSRFAGKGQVTTFSKPSAMVWGPENALWICDAGSGNLVKIFQEE